MKENKNLVMAIALSALILFGWPYIQGFFFPAPPAPPQQAQTTQTQTGQTGAVDSAGVPTIPGMPNAPGTAAAPITREDALANAPRIAVETPRLSGSINLRGARIDDLTLSDYHETLEDGSPAIDLLQPAGGAQPYLVQFGWSPMDGLETPDGDTVWAANGDTLTPSSPVTLTWTNAAGVTFEQSIAVDENFMFTVTQRIVNGSDQTISAVPYGRIFRGAKPKTQNFYILHEGLIGVFDGKLEEIKYDDLEDKPQGKESFATTGGWMGITDKYWLVALVPNQTASVNSTFLRTGTTDGQFHVNFVADPTSVAPGARVEMTDHFFAGAKETLRLDAYSESLGITNFDLAVDFGWFYFLTKPFFFAIHWFHSVLGNFGLAIMALTLCVKICFFPLANKSYKSMSKMKLLQPKIVELRERLGDDKQKLQSEMMELYKKEKVNPLAGCLPVLIQIPVFFSLYKVLFVTIEMRHAPFFGWIHDLSAPDPLGLLTVFGLVPWDVPQILHIVNIGIWPLIMGFTMWFQQRLNPPPADPIQAKIFGLMPIFFTFILGGFPAGLVIYWAWNNSLSILQQYVIMRRMGVAIGGGKAKDAEE
ncbi:membrane protein insertase YidC [Rhodospirillaceae bacterium KN72]|uniref:Membrane protein insertase YidC n=1 Tax=Pacificispira spongiicola TaxID=2729598 RepID=A0A7Y0E0V5_9PROT|nr:membrane protein insertase YidC [Pacificispira spongiicola]NMM45078.1 membrane protein insertase YidC [Pacificispira spongiicola]